MSRNLLFSFPQKAIEGTVGCQCFVYALTSWIVITGLTFFPQALQKKIGHDNTFYSQFFTMICLTFLCLCSLSKLCRCPPRSITTSTTWTSRPLSPRNRTKLYSSKCQLFRQDKLCIYVIMIFLQDPWQKLQLPAVRGGGPSNIGHCWCHHSHGRQVKSLSPILYTYKIQNYIK